jgi:hypothetical protein
MSRVGATFSGFIVAYMLREAGVSGPWALAEAALHRYFSRRFSREDVPL